MGFTRKELESFNNATVPDLLGPGLKLLFVGINPGLWTAATQTHFAHPGNRFYPALLEAGIVTREIDRVNGMSKDDREYMIQRGIGITNLVRRATAKASELTKEELKAGGIELEALILNEKPAVVAVAGIGAFRTAFGKPKTKVGLQENRIGDSELWVVPNPSGLNAHETTSSLATAYRAAARSAGVC